MKRGIFIQYYERLLEALKSYFTTDNWKRLFLQGGCYWFAEILHREIPDSFLMINRIEEHCAVYFDHGLFDVRGKISQQDFHRASDKEISFMKKNYIPGFDTESLESYLWKKGLLESTP